MSSNKRARSEQSSACTECQRRKGKCIGGRPCTFCAKTGRKCIDQPQVSRIPLTRKNMDDLHDRCQRLEALLLQVDPSAEIELQLGSDNVTPHGHDRKHSTATTSSGITTPDEVEDASDTEEDMNPCKFEWHEGRDAESHDPNIVNTLTDGMASLNINSRQVGYLGRSSAAALLRQVYRLMKQHEVTSAGTQNIDFADLMQSPLPSPRISIAEKRLEVKFNEDQLIEAYFLYHHASYPIVHEGVFKDQVRRYRDGTMKLNSHWQTLFRMVMVTGAFMSHTQHDGADACVDMQIYQKVNESFFRLDFFSYGTLEGVQALALMGAYLQKRDNPNTGYNCLGMAMRMALGLGLHRDIAEGKGRNTLGMEIRRRIWWTLYIFDVGASVTFGRPTIPSDKVFTNKPTNVDDSSLTDKRGLLPAPTPGVTVYSAMIAHANLAVLMNRIHLKFFVHPRSLASAPISRSLVAKFDAQITHWQLSLPPHFAPAAAVPHWFEVPRIVVAWKAQNLRMLLYKHFLDSLSYSPRTFDRDKTPLDADPAVHACLAAALATLRSIHAFTAAHAADIWHGVGWYATYYIFQAALVLVTAALTAPRDPAAPAWTAAVHTALESLAVSQRCTAAAARVALVLQSCLQRIAAAALPFALPTELALFEPGDGGEGLAFWGPEEATGFLADVAAGDVCFADQMFGGRDGFGFEGDGELML
ncbi:fungal-specific transcription factor domain-containing protein [Geopyxis carbonaria]|nr:fungal-specific transcription factor domain-containing protein [Geopyxis carbonaria]